MNSFTDPILFLFMAALIDCSPVQVSADEEASIIEAAHAARAEDTADQEFESVSVTKCITYFEWSDPEPGGGRTERVRFYGAFPHIVQTESYREQHSITCYSSVTYYGDNVEDRRDRCGAELERYMRYHGLDHEVRLWGTVSVEDATAYLDHLMNHDFGDEHQASIDDMLQQIDSVRQTQRGSLLRFLASYDHGGCETTYFETYATREDSLVFRDVDGFREIC